MPDTPEHGQRPEQCLPVALGPDFSAGLQFLLQTAAQSGQHSALQAALGDPSVQALVLVLRVGEPPVATLTACLAAPDALGQWLGLSCI